MLQAHAFDGLTPSTKLTPRTLSVWATALPRPGLSLSFAPPHHPRTPCATRCTAFANDSLPLLGAPTANTQVPAKTWRLHQLLSLVHRPFGSLSGKRYTRWEKAMHDFGIPRARWLQVVPVLPNRQRHCQSIREALQRGLDRRQWTIHEWTIKFVAGWRRERILDTTKLR